MSGGITASDEIPEGTANKTPEGTPDETSYETSYEIIGINTYTDRYTRNQIVESISQSEALSNIGAIIRNGTDRPFTNINYMGARLLDEIITQILKSIPKTKEMDGSTSRFLTALIEQRIKPSDLWKNYIATISYCHEFLAKIKKRNKVVSAIRSRIKGRVRRAYLMEENAAIEQNLTEEDKEFIRTLNDEDLEEFFNCKKYSRAAENLLETYMSEEMAFFNKLMSY